MVTRDGIAATPYFQSLPAEVQARLLAVAEECERRARLRGDGETRRSTRRLTCPDCGWQGIRGNRSERCTECQRQRTREKRRQAQRARRRGESGRYRRVDGEHFVLHRPEAFRCTHCGGSYTPRRSTARFCSARCRIAAHRGRSAGRETTPEKPSAC